MVILPGVHCWTWVCNPCLAQHLAWELHWASVSLVGVWVSLQMLGFSQDFPQPVVRRRSTRVSPQAFSAALKRAVWRKSWLTFALQSWDLVCMLWDPKESSASPCIPLMTCCGSIVEQCCGETCIFYSPERHKKYFQQLFTLRYSLWAKVKLN